VELGRPSIFICDAFWLHFALFDAFITRAARGTPPEPTKNTMGKPKNNKKKSAKKSSDQGDLLYVNPSRIRYQHSRIRPTFSGCGRNVMDTLEEIRRGDLNPYDLPVIQVNNDEIEFLCRRVLTLDVSYVSLHKCALLFTHFDISLNSQIMILY